jgi:signal transduction histidine kinase
LRPEQTHLHRFRCRVARATNGSLWYTVPVAKAIRQLASRLEARAPYPLALQSLISLVLLATLPSAFDTAGYVLSSRLALLCALIGAYVALTWLVPVRRLHTGFQLVYLALQLGAASLAQMIAPSQILGYVYLITVLQAVYLFRALVWISFAAVVYALWSGQLIISSNLLEWAQSNLALAFPIVCILAAALLYARQHQRQEYVQRVLHDMQRRCDNLLLHLREAQQRAAQEERLRIAQTIAHDIASVLAQVEQNLSSAIAQAQSSLPQLDSPVAQARAAAGHAIERMREAVATLRHGQRDEHAAEPVQVPILPPTLPPGGLMTLRTERMLNLALPLVFALVAVAFTLLQRPIVPYELLLFVLCSASLVGGYLLTQRLHNPLLVRLSLVGQAAAVLGLVFATQTLPLLLGLLLVLWQMALRFSTGQVITFLVGIQALVALSIARIVPITSSIGTSQLLALGIACVAVVALVGPARRQLQRRRDAEARLLRLSGAAAEFERQLAQMRALAVAVERTRVAREIHDDLGHRLMLLTIQLQLAEDMLADKPDAALEQLRLTREQLHDSWASVLSTTDTVLALDGAGLPSALERLAAQCRALTAMTIHLRVIGDLSHHDPAVAAALFRAAQEGLTNACKYSRNGEVQVLLYCDDVIAELRVRDGCGAGAGAPASVPAGAAGHFGLIGLRERAEQLGGTLEAGALPEGGFQLVMTLPLG